MNGRQRTATYCAIGAIVWTAAQAPWKKVAKIDGNILQSKTVKAPLWDRPSPGELATVELDGSALFAEWIGVGVIYGLAYSALARQGK